MKRVLLTGCAGFIGWRTACLLLEKGCEVTGIDNMNDYYSPDLKEHRLGDINKHANFKFHRIDIEDKDALEEIFKKTSFDAVINLAARAGVRYSVENPRIYLSTNALGTLNLLELMKDFKIDKFVLASTSSLYAGEEPPFTEDMPVNTPISPYAATKKAAEALAYTYSFMYGINVIVARYFTVYGPSGRPDMSIFRFIKWIDEGTPLEVFGDGSQSRDFTYIDDIARGTIMAAEAGTGYEIINLGNNNPHDLNYVISLIENCLGRKSERKTLPFSKADLKATRADISKAKRILNWEPEIPLEEGVKSTVEWYLKNKHWLKDIKI